MKPLYKFSFYLRLVANGENEQEAWDIALAQVIEEVSCGCGIDVPDFEKYKDPVVDTVHLECAVCGIEEEVRTDGMGDWMPEVYLGEQQLGCCCPSCQEKYCIQGDDDLPEVVLHRIDFRGGSCRPLQNTIMNLLNHHTKTLGTKS